MPQNFIQIFAFRALSFQMTMKSGSSTSSTNNCQLKSEAMFAAKLSHVVTRGGVSLILILVILSVGGVAQAQRGTAAPCNEGMTWQQAGNRGTDNAIAGVMDAAIACWEIGVEKNPKELRIWQNLANAYQGQQQLDRALVAFKAALELPGAAQWVEGLTSASTTANLLGLHDEALAFLERARSLRPRDPIVAASLAQTLLILKRPVDAKKFIKKALALRPKDVQAIELAGRIYSELGDMDALLKSLHDAIDLNPDDIENLVWIAHEYLRRKNKQQSIKYAEMAQKLHPNSVEALLVVARIAHEDLQWEQSIKAYSRIAMLEPLGNRTFEAYSNIAGAKFMQYRLKEEAVPPQGTSKERGKLLQDSQKAVANAISLDKASERMKEKAKVELILQKQYVCDWQTWQSDDAFVNQTIWKHLREDMLVLGPLQVHRASADPKLHLAVAVKQAADSMETALASVTKKSSKKKVGSPRKGFFKMPPPPLLNSGRMSKILVGYLCANFRHNSVGHNAWLHLHSNENLRFIVYSQAANDKSQYWKRAADFGRANEGYKLVEGMNDYALASEINGDGVHVLLHLNGLALKSRIGMMGLRPCPIQVNMYGSQGTTGASWVDAMVTDRVVVTPEQASLFTEAQWFMQRTFFATEYAESRKHVLTAEPTSRSELGLPEQASPLLANFNLLAKVDPTSFILWAEVLKAEPKAALWLQQPPTSVAGNLRKFLNRLGGNSSQLHVVEKTKFERHLVDKGAADLVLDTLHVNGHITTTDTLWAGVPMVTAAGEAMSARVAASAVLAVLPAGQMLARDSNDFKSTSIWLVKHPTILKRLRARLRAARPSAALFNTRAWVTEFEAAILMAWETFAMKANGYQIVVRKKSVIEV